jgi:hypothetical protein
MALSPQRRKELRQYLQRCPGVTCRLSRRHDFPLPVEWGKNNNLQIEYVRNQGVYRMTASCNRDCGAQLTYGVDKATGAPVLRRAIKYTRWGYKWEDGEGFPMTSEETAYLLALVLGEANDRKNIPVVAG